MITFTKEQLIASAHARIEFAEMMLAGELEPLKERTWSIELELARIALASLEAEPVAVTDDMAYAFHHALSDSSLGADEVEEIKAGLRAAFANVTAPPAPVSVPDGYRLQPISEYDAMCAAMLQGAENAESRCTIQTAPVLDSLPKNAESRCSNSQVIPDGWVACSERMPPLKTGVIVGKWIGRSWATKWATYIPSHPEANSHGFIMPGGSWEPTHWMPIPAAPQQEV